MKKKISLKKILAYIFIIIGLFAITMPFLLRTISLHQDRKEYESFIKNYNPSEEEALDKKARKYNASIKQSNIAKVDPFDKKSFESESILADKEQIFAYIRIPKLRIKLPIYLDASKYHISLGAAQISGTDIPVGGESTRSVIAGHRGYMNKNMFLYIGDLIEGDSIFIDRAGKSLHYRVSDKEIIDPYDWDSLKPVEGEDMITLLTCDPFIPPSPNRLLVNAKRVEVERQTESKPLVPEVSKESNKSLQRKDTADKSSDKAKYLEIMDYAIAILGSLAILISLFKFLRYLLKRK